MQIKPVHQPQRPEFFLVQRPRKAAFHLSAKLRDPFANELAVEFVIRYMVYLPVGLLLDGFRAV